MVILVDEECGIGKGISGQSFLKQGQSSSTVCGSSLTCLPALPWAVSFGLPSRLSAFSFSASLSQRRGENEGIMHFRQGKYIEFWD